VTPDRQVEEVLEAMWVAGDEKRQVTRDSLFWAHTPKPLLDAAEIDQALEEAGRAGLVSVDGEALALTEAGEELARNVVRRHRLAERLFSDVLDVGQEEAEVSACRIEHLLSPDATDSVCILLGHPTTCPHGRTIPPGHCCHHRMEEARPLVIPATHLRPEEEATVAYLSSEGQERLSRMASLGVFPGSRVQLIQRHPTYMLRFGETTLALDEEIVREIYVRRSVTAARPAKQRRRLLGRRRG
jgi:DtxR family Mn-dependent transcriptional regulator